MVDQILGRVDGVVDPADGEEGGQVGGVAAHHEQDKHPPGDHQESGGDKTREILSSDKPGPIFRVKYAYQGIPSTP